LNAKPVPDPEVNRSETLLNLKGGKTSLTFFGFLGFGLAFTGLPLAFRSRFLHD
jgi:hypothetical protein